MDTDTVYSDSTLKRDNAPTYQVSYQKITKELTEECLHEPLLSRYRIDITISYIAVTTDESLLGYMWRYLVELKGSDTSKKKYIKKNKRIEHELTTLLEMIIRVAFPIRCLHVQHNPHSPPFDIDYHALFAPFVNIL